MCTANWFVRHRTATTIVLSVIMMASALRSQQADGQDQTVTAEQRKQIEDAKSVDELTILAKQFLLTGREPAAKLCVEQICTKDASLLTDPQVQTSAGQWNDFWFITRAEIRAAKLAAGDAAGRLELARWLKQGGVFVQARALVAEAMRINPNQLGARQLLRELEPPLGLDFRYALTRPVILTEYMDTSVKIESGRNFLLLLAPVHYHPTDARLVLVPGLVKVRSEVGKAGRVMGLLLTEEPPKGDTRSIGRAAGAAAATATPPPAAPPPIITDQPPDSFTTILYERLQIELKGGVPTLIWLNTYTTRPIGTGARSTGGPYSTRGGSSGISPREALADKRGEMPANGWLGLLVRFPEDARKLTFELPEAGDETIDLDLLKLVQQSQSSSGKPPQPDGTDPVKQMIQYAGDASGPTAQLALAWLSANLSSISSFASGQGQTQPIGVLLAMLRDVGHADGRVRRIAFDGLMKYPSQLPVEALDLLRTSATESLIMDMLAEVESALTAAAANKNASGAMAGSATYSSDPALQKTLEAIPASQAPANAFAILGACLNSRYPAARQEALRVLLEDGSRQSLQILSDLGKDAIKTVAGQMGQIKNDERKAAILRLLLFKPDNNTVLSVLAGCKNLSVTVVSDDDPLLTALKNSSVFPEARVGLLELLSRSNLAAVANSPKLGQILNTIREEGNEQPQVMAALASLVASNFQLLYESPIPRGPQGSPTPAEQQTGGFEALLAELAMDPTMKDETAAKKAALALVASGRVKGLTDRFVKCDNTERCLQILNALGRARELRDRYALPFCLASMLRHEDPKVLKETLSLLTIIYNDCNKDNRWRVNLAVRQGVDQERLVRLTADENRDVADQATALLKRTIGMTSKEAEDFDRSTGPEARIACVNERILTARNADPVGEYACLVLLDAEADTPPVAGSSPLVIKRMSIPLASGRVTIARTSEGLRISADGVEIGKVDSGDSSGGQPAATPLTSLPADAAALIGEALKSEDARKEGLAGKVDISLIKRALEQQKCELRPDALGGWSGDVLINAASSRTTERPVGITAARIILQPLIP